MTSSDSVARRRLAWAAAVATVLALIAAAVAVGRTGDRPDPPGSAAPPGTGEVTPQATAGDSVPASTEPAPAMPMTDFHAYSTSRHFRSGERGSGIVVVDTDDGALTLGRDANAATWTSPEHAPPGGFTELVASWQADTPPGSWVEIGMQARTPSTTSRWYVMGVWAFDTSIVARRSVNGQDDPVGTIATDTFQAHPAGTPVAYRLRVTLHGTAEARPVLRQVAATTSRHGEPPAAPSPTTVRRTIELPVPAYSQVVHGGEYPAYGGGGEAWCSPTSTAMVLSFFDRGPSADDLARLPPDRLFDAHRRADAAVAFAAIHTFDPEYPGTGNWPFNTAYASAYGLDGSVRRYSSLQPLEEWIAKGVPLVISLTWNNADGDPTNDLDGAPIRATEGHLMVVRGFTESGDVIANDPAGATNAAVRRVYSRGQVERNWLRGSIGTTYVITR